MAFRDLRAFLRLLEADGELSRVTAEVGWDLELGAVSRRALDLRGPALLFETITPALALWPWMSPEERRLGRAPRVYFDATFPIEWGEATPRVIDFRQGWPEAVQQLVLDRWAEYGIEGNTK